MRVGFGGSWFDGEVSWDDADFFASTNVNKMFFFYTLGEAKHALRRAIGALNPGDILVVSSLCCMGDTLEDLDVEALDSIARVGGAIEIGDLNGRTEAPSGDMLLLVARYLAGHPGSHNAPSLQEQRRKRASIVVRRGRPTILPAADIADVCLLLAERSVSVRDLAQQFGVSVTTIYRLRRSLDEG